MRRDGMGMTVLLGVGIVLGVWGCSEPDGSSAGADEGLAEVSSVPDAPYSRAVARILADIGDHYSQEALDGEALRLQVDFGAYAEQAEDPDRVTEREGFEVSWPTTVEVRAAYLRSGSGPQVREISGCPGMGRGACRPPEGTLHVVPGPMIVSTDDGTVFVNAYVLWLHATVIFFAELTGTGPDAEVIRVTREGG